MISNIKISKLRLRRKKYTLIKNKVYYIKRVNIIIL